jgi:hypothetical protein
MMHYGLGGIFLQKTREDISTPKQIDFLGTVGNLSIPDTKLYPFRLSE